MADPVIQRSAWPVNGEPGVRHIPLDKATLLKQSPDTLSDLLHQPLQLGTRGCWHVAEYGRAIARRQIHPIENNHVEVNVHKVQR